MKKFLLCLMAIILLFSLTGCGSDENDNNDNNDVDDTEVVNNNPNPYDEIEVYSDNTKIVFETNDGKLVFYYSGNEITAYHAYLNYQNNANANYANAVLKMDENDDIDKTYVKGKYVVVEYNKSTFENLTLDDVKTTYSYLKELKKGN